MNLRIRLSHLNEYGSIALIENPEGNSTEVFESCTNTDGKMACKAAAKALRAAAKKFDLLAKEKDPFMGTVQHGINLTQP